MKLLKRIFPRRYKPTDNIKRFGEIMDLVSNYEYAVSRLTEDIDFKTSNRLLITEPGDIYGKIHMFEFDLQNSEKVNNRLGYPNRTNHYRGLMVFINDRIRSAQKRVSDLVDSSNMEDAA
jgi:hypothetical protein